jgi:hypothetical protein
MTSNLLIRKSGTKRKVICSVPCFVPEFKFLPCALCLSSWPSFHSSVDISLLSGEARSPPCSHLIPSPGGRPWLGVPPSLSLAQQASSGGSLPEVAVTVPSFLSPKAIGIMGGGWGVRAAAIIRLLFPRSRDSHVFWTHSTTLAMGFSHTSHLIIENASTLTIPALVLKGLSCLLL